MNKICEEIIEDFNLFDDWEGRYSYLIDMGKKLPDMNDEDKIDENIVKGCVSKVWMIFDIVNGEIIIKADSDSQIVRGLVALILKIYNNQDISDIKNIDMDVVFSEIGLDKHLSPNRRNGFFSMIEKIRSIRG